MSERNSIIIPVTLMVSGDGGGGSDSDVVINENGVPQNGQDTKQKQAKEKATSKTNPAKAIASKIAGETLSLALSGYGDITGNYVDGQNLQVAVSEASKIAGAVAMGWVGAALYVVDKAVQGFNYASQLKKSEMQAKFNQKRVYGTTVKS